MWFFYKPAGAVESEFISFIKMKGIAQTDQPFVLGTRLSLLFIFLILVILVNIAWRKKKMQGEKIR
jgi:hypothetical protein